jgi:hypothetical protein
MNKKVVKVQYHPPYSRRIILPKDFCNYLEIGPDDYVSIEIDQVNKSMILKKRGNKNE